MALPCWLHVDIAFCDHAMFMDVQITCLRVALFVLQSCKQIYQYIRACTINRLAVIPCTCLWIQT